MITGINHITLQVNDLNQSFRFYRDVLGMTPLCLWPGGAYLLAGDLWVCLLQGQGSKNPASHSHVAFSALPKDFKILSEKIIDSKAKIWKNNNSEGKSLYFCDPSGNQLEIHIGNWRSRLEHKKQNPWPGTEFYN